jgi:hypothetical protein
MATQDRHSGRFGRIYLGGKKVGSIQSWKLSMKRKKTDVTCMEDLNEIQVQGLPSYSGSYTGVWDDTDTSVFEAQASTVAVTMILYPDYANAPTKFFYGPINVDLDMEGAVDSAVKITGDISAAGNWNNTLGL